MFHYVCVFSVVCEYLCFCVCVLYFACFCVFIFRVCFCEINVLIMIKIQTERCNNRKTLITERQRNRSLDIVGVRREKRRTRWCRYFRVFTYLSTKTDMTDSDKGSVCAFVFFSN